MFILFFLAFALSSSVSAEEIDLSRYEKSFYSPHGEDGVIAKLCQLTEPSNRFFVEIGSGNNSFGSLMHLLQLQGWSGILLDRRHENQPHNLYKEFVTAENINALFTKYNIPDELTFLAIDLRYNSFYIWEALSEKYKPSFVIIKYNSTFSSQEDKVVKYYPYFCGDHTSYFGASITALYHLGRSKGYSLLYTEESGHHLFFIRDQLLHTTGLQFKHINDPEKLYRASPQKTSPVEETSNKVYFTSETCLERSGRNR